MSMEDFRKKGREAREKQEKAQTSNVPNTLEGFKRKGQEARRAREENEKQRRERAAAKGAAGMDWRTIGGGAGLVAGGLAFATGKVLKLALLGWSIDGSGQIRKDTATLGAFDRAYNAMKGNEGVITALGKGMGMAA